MNYLHYFSKDEFYNIIPDILEIAYKNKIYIVTDQKITWEIAEKSINNCLKFNSPEEAIISEFIKKSFEQLKNQPAYWIVVNRGSKKNIKNFIEDLDQLLLIKYEASPDQIAVIYQLN